MAHVHFVKWGQLESPGASRLYAGDITTSHLAAIDNAFPGCARKIEPAPEGTGSVFGGGERDHVVVTVCDEEESVGQFKFEESPEATEWLLEGVEAGSFAEKFRDVLGDTVRRPAG